EANAKDLVHRAGGTPIRVATKSVRVPELISRVLSRSGFAGAMTFSLPEAIFLISEGITDDALMGYPTVDSAGLSALAEEPHLRQGITLMVDHPAHIDLLASLPRQGEAPFQVCI